MWIVAVGTRDGKSCYLLVELGGHPLFLVTGGAEFGFLGLEKERER